MKMINISFKTKCMQIVYTYEKKKIVQNMLTSFSANVREACATAEQYDNEKKSIK